MINNVYSEPKMRDSYLTQEPYTSTANTSPKPKESESDNFSKSMRENSSLAKSFNQQQQQFSGKFGGMQFDDPEDAIKHKYE